MTRKGITYQASEKELDMLTVRTKASLKNKRKEESIYLKDGLESDKAELVRWMKARRVVFVVVVVVVMEGKRMKLVLVVKRDWSTKWREYWKYGEPWSEKMMEVNC